MTYQERNVRAADRRAKRVSLCTLIIPVRSWAEREHVRERVWYSGASDDYIATSMRALPLAIDVVLRMRKADVARVHRTKDGNFELRTYR